MRAQLILMTTLLISQSFLPVSAQTVHYVSGTDNGLLDGKGKVKVVGPMSVDDGDVVFAQNKISILSDTSDPISEAELTGRTFNVSQTGTDSVSGLALFLKGYSLSSIDDPKIEETVKLRSGSTITGRISDATDSGLQMNVAASKRSVPYTEISDISSPRCFSFTTTTAASVKTTSQSGAKPALVTFKSNYVPLPPSISTLLPTTAMLEGQLTQHHMSKKLLEYSAGLVFLGACFAVPIALAISTPHISPSLVKKTTDIVKKNVASGKLDDTSGSLGVKTGTKVVQAAAVKIK